MDKTVEDRREENSEISGQLNLVLLGLPPPKRQLYRMPLKAGGAIASHLM